MVEKYQNWAVNEKIGWYEFKFSVEKYSKNYRQLYVEIIDWLYDSIDNPNGT